MGWQNIVLVMQTQTGIITVAIIIAILLIIEFVTPVVRRKQRTIAQSQSTDSFEQGQNPWLCVSQEILTAGLSRNVDKNPFNRSTKSFCWVLKLEVVNLQTHVLFCILHFIDGFSYIWCLCPRVNAVF